MGSNIDLKVYLDERLSISQELLNILVAWDGNIDSMDRMVEESGYMINKLKDITLKISNFSMEEIYDEKYESNLKKIIDENKNFIDKVEVEKSKLLINMKQTNKAKDIRDSYVAPEVKPMFIDRNL